MDYNCHQCLPCQYNQLPPKPLLLVMPEQETIVRFGLLQAAQGNIITQKPDMAQFGSKVQTKNNAVAGDHSPSRWPLASPSPIFVRQTSAQTQSWWPLFSVLTCSRIAAVSYPNSSVAASPLGLACVEGSAFAEHQAEGTRNTVSPFRIHAFNCPCLLNTCCLAFLCLYRRPANKSGIPRT